MPARRLLVGLSNVVLRISTSSHQLRYPPTLLLNNVVQYVYRAPIAFGCEWRQAELSGVLAEVNLITGLDGLTLGSVGFEISLLYYSMSSVGPQLVRSHLPNLSKLIVKIKH